MRAGRRLRAGLARAPLSLTAPGTSPTATLRARPCPAHRCARDRHPATTATPRGQAGDRRDAGAAAAPRNPLVRIPDGAAGGGVAGTVNTTQLTTGSAALLRRRTAVEEDAFAPLGGACRHVPGAARGRGDRRLRHQSGAHAERTRRPSFVTVSPELIARSDWQRHEVTAALRGSYTAYDKTPELDRPSFDGKVTGRFDVTRDTALIGEGHADRRHRQSRQPERAGGADALSDLHHARRHVRPDAALQPRRGHRQGHGRAHRIPGSRNSPTAPRRATTTATTIASAARCAPATT